MTLKRNSPAANGAEKSTQGHITKPATFLQEPLLWQAHRASVQRFQIDPSPINRIVAQTMADRWKNAFQAEVLQ